MILQPLTILCIIDVNSRLFFAFIFYEWIKSSSTVTCSSLARLKANANVGSYLLFSIALIVWRETPHFFASSSCSNPNSLRLLLIIFSTSATMLSFIIHEGNEIDNRGNLKLNKGICNHWLRSYKIFNYI